MRPSGTSGYCDLQSRHVLGTTPSRELEQTRSSSLLRHASAGTLVNLLPAAVPAADGSLHASVSEQRLARLQSAGLVARVVRHRKGHINRAILFLRPGESKPMSASSVMGTRYSLKELLDHGPAWDLKRLGANRDGKTYAPPEMRTAFLQVVADCLVP